MTTRAISIEVEERLADLYQNATEEEKRKLRLWLELFLGELGSDPRARLLQLVGEMRRETAEKGLTEEILQGILDED